jgi:ABC-type lipoprotein release transport system permease subunit
MWPWSKNNPTIAVVIGAGLLASSVPARRASRVDATTALRQE